MPNLNTEEWKIAIHVEFVPKKTWDRVKCPDCLGTGKPRVHFGVWEDDDNFCKVCSGKGWRDVQVFPKEPKPKLLEDLLDHMKKAYLEYKLK